MLIHAVKIIVGIINVVNNFLSIINGNVLKNIFYKKNMYIIIFSRGKRMHNTLFNYLKLAGLSGEYKDLLIILIPSLAGGILLLIFILFLLFRFVFIPNRLKREIHDLDRRFEYLHALLIGQDAQYVKRLEIISRSNLLYVETHTRFLKKFKEIRDKHDASAQSTINHLKDLLDEKKYKLLKEAISDSKEIIAVYEKEVNALNNDLLLVVKPEEDCRQNALSLKEQLRRIKQDYYAKQGDLQLLAESFEEIFSLLDSKFETFEANVESAQYDDANKVLPDIEVIINELNSSMDDLPKYCTMVVNLIPDKISSLENSYETMIQERYPLHHLVVTQSIKEMKEELIYLTNRIKRFELKNIDVELDNMLSRIEEFFTLFNEEKEARKIFDEENESVYQVVNELDRTFIKLRNSIPQYKQIYRLNDLQEQKINEIQNSINIQGAFKRSLDTYIHSSTQQPYSVLVTKIKELKDASTKVKDEINDFEIYLESLKTDSEGAYALIYEAFDKAINAYRMVKIINLEVTDNKYLDVIKRSFELIDGIYEHLNMLPIDVEVTNNLAKELKDIIAKYYDDGDIKKDFNLMILAENSIEIINRDRQHLSDIDHLASHCEQLFFDGNFEQAYINALQTIKRIRSDREN